MEFSRTIVISCAGMGNRLGLGTTKALVEVVGKPLIIRHLEMLKEEQDIRVVVGYQAEKIIDAVKQYRKDVIFVLIMIIRTQERGLVSYLRRNMRINTSCH